MTVQWSDALKNGDAEIGAQHQKLCRRVNFLLDRTGHLSLAKCHINLFKFTREHSPHEEHVMRKIRFSDIISQRIEHIEILTKLNRVTESITNKTFVKQDWRVFFSVWLIHQFETSDRGLVADLKFGFRWQMTGSSHCPFSKKG